MRDEERPKGFLSEKQREALASGEFYERTGSSARVLRHRTKKRLKGALLDFQHLDGLRFEDLQSIFDWFYENDTDPWEIPEHTDRQNEFERGVGELIAALYDGMGELNFSLALKTGVGTAIERRELAARGRLAHYDVQFNVEFDDDDPQHLPIESLKDELEQYDGPGAPESFMYQDVWALWVAGEITDSRRDELFRSLGPDRGEAELTPEDKEKAAQVAEKWRNREAQPVEDLLYLVFTGELTKSKFDEIAERQCKNVHVLYCQGPEEVAEEYKPFGHQIREEHQDDLEAAWRAHQSHVEKMMNEADGNVEDVPREHLDCLEVAGLITDEERKSLRHDASPPRRNPRDPTAVPGDYTMSPCDDKQEQSGTRQIPSQRKMIELLRSGDLSPKGYLDILETRFEEAPETLVAEDLWDLLRSERISEDVYLTANQSWEDDASDLPPKESREHVREHYTEDG